MRLAPLTDWSLEAAPTRRAQKGEEDGAGETEGVGLPLALTVPERLRVTVPLLVPVCEPVDVMDAV
jgi:hypothetical protein